VTGFDVTARRATPDDLDSVLALDADIHMGHNVQSLLARRVLAGECWLAQDGARVVASSPCGRSTSSVATSSSSWRWNLVSVDAAWATVSWRTL